MLEILTTTHGQALVGAYQPRVSSLSEVYALNNVKRDYMVPYGYSTKSVTLKSVTKQF